jgi:endonuclease YncB( thermonuclease family)
VIYRFYVRLNGIDSPEIKGKTETEKKLAKQSRDALNNLIYGKIVKLENISMEKYGRLLAIVMCNSINVNNWMLENKYAVPYDGGKKIIPEEWE